MINACRKKKQELVSFAQSAKELFQTDEDSTKSALDNSLQTSLDGVSEKASKCPTERVKIVISIQDRDGLKQFRVYMVCTISIYILAYILC